MDDNANNNDITLKKLTFLFFLIKKKSLRFADFMKNLTAEVFF